MVRLLGESNPHTLSKARFIKGCKNTVHSLKWLLLGFDPELAARWWLSAGRKPFVELLPCGCFVYVVCEGVLLVWMFFVVVGARPWVPLGRAHITSSRSSTRRQKPRRLPPRNCARIFARWTWRTCLGAGRCPSRPPMVEKYAEETWNWELLGIGGGIVWCRQAADEFLKDLLSGNSGSGWKGGLRWGPLLAWSFLHDCPFTTTNGYLEPMMSEAEYMQVADDALQGIRFCLPQFGIKPQPRAPNAPSTLIMKKFARSPKDTNRALLQARFMDLDMFNRFFKLDGLELFFNNDAIMRGALFVETAPQVDVADWFLDSAALGKGDEETGDDRGDRRGDSDPEAIDGDRGDALEPAVFMHISQEWFIIAEAKYDYVLESDYLHCLALSWLPPSCQTLPPVQLAFRGVGWVLFVFGSSSCAAMASRGWKIPGDHHGEVPELRCGLKEELKGGPTANGYRLNVGGPHDLVRMVALAHKGRKVPMFLEMASPREHGRPFNLCICTLTAYSSSLPTCRCYTNTLFLKVRVCPPWPRRSLMKHFWRCTSVPPKVLEAWRSPRRLRRVGGGESSSSKSKAPAQHHANSCEYMGGQRWS